MNILFFSHCDCGCDHGYDDDAGHDDGGGCEDDDGGYDDDGGGCHDDGSYDGCRGCGT